MASGSGLATALAALKGHAVAVAVVGTLVVGGGATAAAVATGTVHVPGVNAPQQSQNENGGTTARAAACANNGDAQRLAGIFAPMFDGKTANAQEQICTLFVGSDGHARGFGEIQQALEITAAIEHNGDDACLTGGATHGTPTAHGTPTTKGKPPTAGTPAAGQPTFTAPPASSSATMAIITKVLDAADHGTPLAELAKLCGASHVTGGGDQGQPEGTPEAKPTGTPGEKPEGTPGAKPTGTPGAH
jgi:hypothetical protein